MVATLAAGAAEEEVKVAVLTAAMEMMVVGSMVVAAAVTVAIVVVVTVVTPWAGSTFAGGSHLQDERTQRRQHKCRRSQQHNQGKGKSLPP